MNNDELDQTPAIFDWWHQQLYSVMCVVMASYAIVWLFLCTLVMGGRASRPTDSTPRLSLTNAKRWMGVVIAVALLECAVNYLVVLHFSNTDAGDYCWFLFIKLLLFINQLILYYFLIFSLQRKKKQRKDGRQRLTCSHARVQVLFMFTS